MKASENLVEEKFEMFFGEGLVAFEYLMQVSVHKLENDINVIKLFPGHGHYEGFHVDDVFVFEQL